MFEDIKKRRWKYRQKIEDRSNKLERARINNERIRQLKTAQEMTEGVLGQIRQYRRTLSVVSTAVTTEARGYQTRRMSYINAVITEAVNRIFPQKQFEVQLSCEYLRSDSVKLRLLDRFQNNLIPHVCSGKLMQYLISFSAVSGITKSLGCNALYIDEAFGVSSIRNLGEIGKLIQRCIDDGMQIVLIAQNPELYNDLSRREIRLGTDSGGRVGAADRVVVQEIVDI